MIHIYFGKNGIGKSEKLKTLYDNDTESVDKFILYSNKNLSPETFDNDGAKGLWKQIEIYINKKLIKNYEVENNDDYFHYFEKLNLKFLGLKAPQNDDVEQKIIDTTKKIEINELLKKTTIYKINKKIFPEQYGHGNMSFHSIQILCFIFQNFEGKVSLYLDEPEKHLHPQMIKEMAILLNDLYENSGKSINIIIATHSTILINYLLNETGTKLFTKNNYKERDFVEIEINNDLFIKNTFRYRNDLINSLFANKTIIVEGNNDLKFIEYYLFKKKKFNINVIPVSGKDNIKSAYNNLINIIKINEKKIFIIYDQDYIEYDETDKKHNYHHKINNTIEKLNDNTDNTFRFVPNIEQAYGFNFEKDDFNSKQFEEIIENDEFKNDSINLDNFVMED